jgi:hypothetical protein
LRAENKAGLPVPWSWTRRVVARAWGVPPWMVDEAPMSEVQLEILLHNLEAEHGRRET